MAEITKFQPDLLLYCCLEQIGCSGYFEAFVENEIDLEIFKLLTKDDLGSIIPKLGPQRKVLQEIERLKQIDNANQAPATCHETQTSTHSPPPSGNLTKQIDVKECAISNQVPTTFTNLSEKNPINKSETKTSSKGNSKALSNAATSSSPISKTSAPNAVSAEQESLLKKYGICLPSAGDFATNIAIGTAQKFIIDKITYPMTFGKFQSPAPTVISGTKPDAEVIDPMKLKASESSAIGPEENQIVPTAAAGHVISNSSTSTSDSASLNSNSLQTETHSANLTVGSLTSETGVSAKAAAMEEFNLKYSPTHANVQAITTNESIIQGNTDPSLVNLDPEIPAVDLEMPPLHGTMESIESGVSSVELLEQNGDATVESLASGITSLLDWF